MGTERTDIGSGAGANAAGGKHTASAGSRADDSGAESSAGSAGAAPADGLESVGLVADQAERERLTAELDARLAEQAPAPAGPADAGAGEWKQLCPPLVTIGCAIVLPQWGITADEQREFSAALADCLEQLFPGGLNGRYACWVRLIAAGSAIVMARAVQHGRLPPLFAPKRIVGQTAPPSAQVPRSLTE